MRLILFVDNEQKELTQSVSSIFALSESWMLFFSERDDKTNLRDIRSVKLDPLVLCYDWDTGESVDLHGLLNFEIFNQENEMIFSSVDLISDEEFKLKFGFVKKLVDEGEE